MLNEARWSSTKDQQLEGSAVTLRTMTEEWVVTAGPRSVGPLRADKIQAYGTQGPTLDTQNHCKSVSGETLLWWAGTAELGEQQRPHVTSMQPVAKSNL